MRRPLTGMASGKPSKAAAGASPTSSHAATGAWRATAATSWASGTARWSSTLVETCAIAPWAVSSRPSARTPGSPSEPPSRMSAAIARASASVAGGASSKLKATSGGRAATRTAPAVGCGRGGPKSGVSSPSAIRRRSSARPPRRRNARVRPPASNPYKKTGSPTSSPSRSATASASAHATPRRASSRKTTGATSSAPTCGWMPRSVLRSIRATAVRAPATSASARTPGGAASVWTERW